MRLMLFLCALVLAACSEAPPVDTPPRTVLVQRVSLLGADPTHNVYTGEVRARHEHLLGFRIAGKVVERKVDVGAMVKKGELLARLDPQDVLLAAQAANAQVGAAEAALALARSEFERSERLHQTGFISASALDSRRSALDAADAALRQARAQAGIALNQSEYALLRSEQAGVVVEAPVEPGQVVAAGQTVFRVVQPEPREVLINVPESRIQAYTLGQAAVILPLGHDKPYVGAVREIAPVADPATRTYALRVAIAAPDALLSLGASAHVVFDEARSAGVTLPLGAVTAVDASARVWLVGGDDTVGPAPVVIDGIHENGVRVTSGLEEGSRVVVAGVHRLVEGERVRVVEVDRPVALDAER